LELGDVYVIFNGGTGTISEFGMAWGLARLFFGKHKPMILYGSWWYEIMEAFGRNMLLREEELRVYEIVSSPEQVLEKIKELDKG
jgi:predicted Rossmann-fold nucleotide-binding protein